jgi:hypothetical protein
VVSFVVDEGEYFEVLDSPISFVLVPEYVDEPPLFTALDLEVSFCVLVSPPPRSAEEIHVGFSH